MGLDTLGSDFQEIAFGVGDDGFVVSVSGETRQAYDANSCCFHFFYDTIHGGARAYGDGEMRQSWRLTRGCHQFEASAGGEREEQDWKSRFELE